ncbi:uncharacterized protein N7515_004375 [Penicillium bovifimosum]|uniref:DUF7820 domain-containing protein n=1 Tax=Penicillium bovifimosum TaxID=126998 RepID=A0A9W9H004_9EURO|nr:uncharacterized protein N7515_004375 [Penicillium bovifimosum]KAJ5135097.1 hypothetical protein N7515_004375 [Penicillium bovifimosum]
MSGHMSSEHSRSNSRSSRTPRTSQGESTPRHSFGRTFSNPNVFADEYALEPIDSDHIERPHSPSSIISSATLRENTQSKTVSTATTENENPFGDDARVSLDEPHRSSLPQKGYGFANNHNPTSSLSSTPSLIQRNQSVSSRFSIPRALSPYTGATGPSHPYGMYPQVGVSRSPSVGSISTIRPVERPLEDSTGPQHPYAMYSQNVVEDGMDDEIIPVGFPGHNQPYQPSAGRPADDVGDIIGPDGHAEPLPPYSRYPAGVIPKPPTPEIMADLNTAPEEQRLNNESPRPPPISETSSRALVPEQSAEENNEGNREERAVATTGIMAFEEKLKRKGKKTACCGLPVWTLVLIGTVMLIGGCIGGVIGGVLGTKKAAEASKADEEEAQKSRTPPIVTVTSAPQMDASLIPTPTNLKTIPTGHYMVPAGYQNGSGLCVDESNYGKAWKCMQAPGELDVYVGETKGHHSIVFDYGAPTTTFTYGAQAPYWPAEPTQALRMAIDTTDADLGPALFFLAPFDKLVIVPEDTFSSSLSRRSYVDDGWSQADAYKSATQSVEVGDKPWFCWWNNTMMEFFMYVNQSTSYSVGSTASVNSDMASGTAGVHVDKRVDSSVDDYPRRIKIEERRDDPTRLSPYCQQMQIRKNGGLALLSGQIINIEENEPTPTTTSTGYVGGSPQTYTAQASYASPCYCVSLTD